MIKFNPKALNLDKIRYTDKKVTLGFKCKPKLKIQLASKAEMGNMTLSEYVETLVVNQEKIHSEMQKQVEELKANVSFYEDNTLLKNIFTRNYGKVVRIAGVDNKTIQIKINSVRDVFSAIVNSFKAK